MKRSPPSQSYASLRLLVSLLEQIKIEANQRDVLYQSLIKVWLAKYSMQGAGAARERSGITLKSLGRSAG